MSESMQRATLITVLESEDNTVSLPAVVSTMQAIYTLIEEIHAGQEYQITGDNNYRLLFQMKPSLNG